MSDREAMAATVANALGSAAGIFDTTPEEDQAIADALIADGWVNGETAWNEGAEMGHRLYLESLDVIEQRNPYRKESSK